MQYRPEIDGLRAIAVISVVAYHAAIPTFPGGYIGVDVFFVISGYLITSIIWPSVSTGSFSILTFYERRARRILPALLTVAIATLILSSAFLLPVSYGDTAEAAIAALFSFSNVHFWRQTGYFAGSAELEPLLHTWSLGVEEQFYLLFPLVLILLHKVNRAFAVPAVAICGVLSFASGIWALDRMPSAGFYLTPFRAWELALGALLALRGGSFPSSAIVRNGLSMAGIAAIGSAVVLFQPSTPFPGAAALLPCAGAAAIIAAGPVNLVGRILAARPLVFVGLISYSLYLWHWPLLVAARHLEISPHVSLPGTGVAVGLSFALAALSWRYIERPFRDGHVVSTRGLAAATVAASAALVSIAATIIVTSGMPSRFDPTVIGYAEAAADYSKKGLECLGADPADRRVNCGLGDPSQPTSYVLWGDSHAGALVPAMEVALNAIGRRGAFVGHNSCPPLIAVSYNKNTEPDTSACLRTNDRAVELTRSSAVETVVMVAYWQSYINALPARYAPTSQEGLDDAPFARDFERTVRALISEGKRVIIIGGLPNPRDATPWKFALAAHFGKPLPEVPMPFGPDDLEVIIEHRQLPVTYISLRDAICDESTCTAATSDGLIFADGNHLSSASARLIGPYLAARL